MDVVVNKLEGCKRSVEITLPAEQANGVYKEMLEDFRRNLRLPGFRRGKVPESLIEKRFSKELQQEVISKLVPKAVDEAIQKEQLRPVERPTLEDVEYAISQPLRIQASFEIRPELQLEKYAGLTVKISSEQYKVTDKEVDEQLEKLQEQSAHFTAVEETRPVVVGDFAEIDLRGEPQAKSGIPFKREGILVEVTESTDDGGFARNLIGMAKGQTKEFDLRYPDDYRDVALAGSEINYTVDLKEIKKRILPALDDEFAKDLGQFESLDDLQKEVRHQLEHEKQHQRSAEIEKKMIESIIAENTEFELPQVMVQRQMAARENELRRHMQSRGFNPDHIGYDWTAYRKAERPNAEFSVRKLLILDEIADKEHLDISPKEVKAEIENIAAANGRDPKEMRREMMKDGSYEMIERHLRDRKTVRWLIEKNKVTEGK